MAAVILYLSRLQNRLKIYAICLVAILSVGYYLLHRSPAADMVSAPELLESAVKSSVQVVRNKTTSTMVHNPNGTTTKIVVKDNTTTTNSNESEHVSASPGKPLSKYSVQITTSPFDYKAVNIGVGARLGDLPAFGVVEYEIKEHTVKAGIRVEW